MGFKNYEIIETPFAPIIGGTRMSVYDILLAQKEGDSLYEICGIYGLMPLEVQVAFEYIEENREKLEAALPEILAKKAENERYHRAIQAELWKEIRALPMTPERQAFYELHEKNRKLLGIDGN